MFRVCCTAGEPSLPRAVSFEQVDAIEAFNDVPTTPVPQIPILLEIVGATDLPTKVTKKGGEKVLPDTHCVVSIVGDYGKKKEIHPDNMIRNILSNTEIVHKTQIIPKDDNPIWTVKTKSLCVVPIPDVDEVISGQSDEEAAHEIEIEEEEETEDGATISTVPSDESQKLPTRQPIKPNTLIVQVYNGKKLLGHVDVSFHHLLQGKGEREEFPLVLKPSTKKEDTNDLQPTKPSILALRFRHAKPEEVSFLNNMGHSRKGLLVSAVSASARTLRNTLVGASEKGLGHDTEAMDVDFYNVPKKSIFKFYKKKDPKTGDTLIRLHPPKVVPGKPEETIKWMTKEQMDQEALKPSTKWVETGHGETGTLYLEIIGCDNLPAMDMVNQSSDPFVGIVFEDTMVRTKVLFETLFPRWMPWSTRAFAFNITHPGSMLNLGVFDHDEDIGIKTDYHDPIGRVVINTINFESGVTYMLQYDLVDSSQIDTPRGTITLRIRIQWKDENEAAKLALMAPPRNIINVETEKAWRVLHYCTVGAINMDKPSMASIRLYAGEVYQFWRSYCYFLDVVANILLWRGRIHVSHNTTVWFPIQSIWLFSSVALAYEKPCFAPAILFYGLAWIMISVNIYYSHHPYPWYRVKTFGSLVLGVLFGARASSTHSVQANTTASAKAMYDALDKRKTERMMALISAFLRTGLKAYNIYSGTSITSVVDTTQDTSFYFLSDKLYYPHMLLKYISKYGRSFRNFVTWQSYASLPKTLNLLFLGSICLATALIYPLHWVAENMGRVLIWTLLGPLMKVVDIVWVQRLFKTNEELLDDIRNDRPDDDYLFLNFFDSIIELDAFDSMRQSGRHVCEHAAKLKDMRETLHGTWSETVPWVDNSRRPSVPLPTSTASPFDKEMKAREDRQHWKFVPSKSLEGDMIMQCPGCGTINESAGDTTTQDETKKEQ